MKLEILYSIYCIEMMHIYDNYSFWKIFIHHKWVNVIKGTIYDPVDSDLALYFEDEKLSEIESPVWQKSRFDIIGRNKLM